MPVACVHGVGVFSFRAWPLGLVLASLLVGVRAEAHPRGRPPAGTSRTRPMVVGRKAPPTRAFERRVAREQLRRYRRTPFERLGDQLAATLRTRGDLYARGKPRDIVVLSSLSLDRSELQKVPAAHLYEERLLFTLLHLQDPTTRVVFVSSAPVDRATVDYYLSLLPDPAGARARLKMVSLGDERPIGLADKLIEPDRAADRRRVFQEIMRFVDRDKAHLYPFVVTRSEERIANGLRVPLLGSRSELAWLGTKAGSRATFARAGVPHPEGSGELNNVPELVGAVDELLAARPRAARFVVKLNEGFSGEGNAILKLPVLRRRLARIESRHGSPERREAARRKTIESYLQKHLRYQASGETWGHFSAQIGRLGAIVEEFVEGEVKTAPSVQLYVGPSGKVEILSTYDQMLGGRDGQVYLGGSSPADPAYRKQLHEYGKRVAAVLAKEGVRGRFAVDFIASKQSDGTWDLSALEVNLRLGGTTHTTNTMKTLVNLYGRYDEELGTLRSARDGKPKYLVGTDTVGDPAAGDLLGGASLKGLTPAQLQRFMAPLKYDPKTETGLVLHLMGALRDHGKVGFTVIADSPEAAKALHDRALARLAEAGRTLARE